MEDRILISLTALPDVDGAFLSHRNGRVLAQAMPAFFAREQLQKATNLLTQHRNAASAAVGEIKRCEFRYLNHKFFVYYLPQGQLFVLCRPQADHKRIDLEVQTHRQNFNALLQQTSQTEQTRSSNLERAPVSPSEAAESIEPMTGKPADGKNKSHRRMAVLVATACLLIALLGVGFFFLPGETRKDQALADLTPNMQHSTTTSPQTRNADSPQQTLPQAQQILRLHGSNTVGAKLAPALVEQFIQQELQAKEISRVPGSIADQQTIEATLDNGRRISVEIHAHGSSTSFKDLDKELCDIGMSSRPIKENEVEQLKRFGNLTAPASEHVLALDGIAVIIHPANGIQELSQQQIADIFSGQIKSWGDIPQSGLSGRIQVIARDDKSGTWDTFKDLALRGRTLVETAERIEDSRELTAKVAADINAIGFIGLPYIKPSKAISVSESGTEAVFPTTFTVATEDYPLARRLFLYIPENPLNPMSRKFIEFALGEEGQRIVREVGFVELTIDKIAPAIPPTAPEAYQKNVADAQRLSLNFRFRIGSSSIDNRSLRDIDRLVEFLGKPENRHRSIKLFGFADNIGSRSINCNLSQTRADTVADILKTRGIVPLDVRGFCDDMPVASNATPAGREKNRRVEVWLAK